MGTLIQDVLFAFRMIRKSPGSASVVVLTLALGIGANTAIFSVVNAVLLQPLPYPEADRLIQVVRSYPDGGHAAAVSVPKFVYWFDNNQVFERMAAYDIYPGGVNISGDGPPERLTAFRATAEFFSVFGVQPALGRSFLAEEDLPGAPRVIVMSHGLWKRRFGGDPSLVGKQLTLDEESFKVIGVMPEGFSFPSDADLCTPLQLDRSSRERAHFLLVTGRLKAGVRLEQARSEMQMVGERFIADQGGIGALEKESVTALPLQEYLYGSFRPAFLVLLGAVALVLLIACANVANVKLARAAARKREIAIRTSLGAGWARIVRQLLTESVVLSIMGGLAGLLLCAWSMGPLLALTPIDLPVWSRVSISGTVLAFALGVAALTGILTGLAPALHGARKDIHASLKESSLQSAGQERARRMRKVLVTGEIALTLIVVVSAMLLARSFVHLMGTDPGFDPRNVLTMKLSLGSTKFGDSSTLENLQRNLLPSVENLPGVRSAALAVSLPLEPGWHLPFIVDERYDEGTGEGWGAAQYRAVSPNYLETMGIDLLRGRTFTASDSSESSNVVIINNAAARRFWPDEDPIGQQITVGPPEFPDVAPSRVVVGVVGDVNEAGLEHQSPAILYVPVSQLPERWAGGLDVMSLVIKTELDPVGLSAAVQEEIYVYDPDLPVMNARTMDDLVARSVGPREFNLILMGLFAGLALLLAAVGIHGVLSYIVSQRTHEIGIRMALGAESQHVLKLVAAELMPLLVMGLMLGVVGALALNRVMSSMLFGVSSSDPATLIGVGLGLAAVALMAGYLPARRATRVEPVVALRYE